ncbi:hypothetical protein CYMTET_25376 [Cymbomonas tetramitiformis]|uniref:Ion transport domain-containing protein n=1 Tax=Cymbomonas tetramitiformis TaxID=36881 RepID=A0AAE0FUN2_9CHLO|nr:hypothetical protein CYMTET_25376 [Cymbomonas tetramitiformis]
MLFDYYRSMELRLDMDVQKMQMFKFLMMIFLVAHWVGLVYFFIARELTFDESTWIDQISNQLSGYHIDSNLMSHYLIVMYKGFNGMTNLGYENVLPNNFWEMTMAIIVIYLQILIAAYILGTMFNYLVKHDPWVENYKVLVKRMTGFLQHYGIHRDIINEIHNHLHFQHQKGLALGVNSQVSPAVHTDIPRRTLVLGDGLAWAIPQIETAKHPKVGLNRGKTANGAGIPGAPGILPAVEGAICPLPADGDLDGAPREKKSTVRRAGSIMATKSRHLASLAFKENTNTRSSCAVRRGTSNEGGSSTANCGRN